MKKILSTMLAVSVAVLLSGVAFATPGDDDATEQDTNPGCASGDAVCIDTDDVESQSGQDGPVDGVVAAGGDPATQQGYIFADGNGSNADPLDGYVGATSGDGGLIGATDGHAHRAGGNSPFDPTALLP